MLAQSLNSYLKLLKVYHREKSGELLKNKADEGSNSKVQAPKLKENKDIRPNNTNSGRSLRLNTTENNLIINASNITVSKTPERAMKAALPFVSNITSAFDSKELNESIKNASNSVVRLDTNRNNTNLTLKSENSIKQNKIYVTNKFKNEENKNLNTVIYNSTVKLDKENQTSIKIKERAANRLNSTNDDSTIAYRAENIDTKTDPKLEQTEEDRVNLESNDEDGSDSVYEKEVAVLIETKPSKEELAIKEKKSNKAGTSKMLSSSKSSKSTIINSDQYVKLLEREREEKISYEKIITIGFSLMIVGCIMMMMLGLLFVMYINSKKQQ